MRFILVFLSLLPFVSQAQVDVNVRTERKIIKTGTVTTSKNFAIINDQELLPIDITRILKSSDAEAWELMKTQKDSLVVKIKLPAFHPVVQYLNYKGKILFHGMTYDHLKIPKVNDHEIEDMSYHLVYEDLQGNSYSNVLLIEANSFYKNDPSKSFNPMKVPQKVENPSPATRLVFDYFDYKGKVYTMNEFFSLGLASTKFMIIKSYEGDEAVSKYGDEKYRSGVGVIKIDK
jgi:hypothetical protein